jgi:uncharacterized RDD family membrane protein YckC
MSDGSHAEGPVHSILSPEAVQLELPVSGPAPRMLAYVIDQLVTIALFVFLLILLFMSETFGASLHQHLSAAARGFIRGAKMARTNPNAGPHFSGVAIALLLLIQYIVETGYFIFWEVSTGGRSPGKFAVGLRVIRRDGLPIDVRSSVIRNLMRIVDLLPGEYLIGITSILLSPAGERLGDHVAGTIVVRLDRPESAPEIQEPTTATALVLTREQLARIGTREIQLLRNVLRRSASQPESRRGAVIVEVAEAMRTRLGLDAVPGGDDLAFLQALLASAERSLRTS